MDDVYEEQKQVANARVAWFLPQRFWITALSVVALLSLCHPEKALLQTYPRRFVCIHKGRMHRFTGQTYQIKDLLAKYHLAGN